MVSLCHCLETIEQEPLRSQYEFKSYSFIENSLIFRIGFPDSNVFGFEVSTLNFEFIISGDTTKEGRFHFGFVFLCVNSEQERVSAYGISKYRD